MLKPCVTECTHVAASAMMMTAFVSCPVDGRGGTGRRALGRGLLLGQFQIQSVCGHGATGTVYRAVQADGARRCGQRCCAPIC